MGNTNNTSAGREKNFPGDSVAEGSSTSEIIVSESRSTTMHSSHRPHLTFSTVHGENVSLEKQGRRARRHESFCKGLAFSGRPVDVDEVVVMKLTETASNWSGVLRFGVTNTNPQSLSGSLPKYACPDLTNKEGNWAKALTERFCTQGNLIHFYVTTGGEMHYGVNGVMKGIFLSGINVALPLWVLLDIYGNSTCVEFMDPSEVPSLNKSRHPTMQSSSSSAASTSTSQRPAPPVPPQPVNSSSFNPAKCTPETANAMSAAQNALDLNQRLLNSAAHSSGTISRNNTPVVPMHMPHNPANQIRPASVPAPGLTFNTGLELTPLEFHQITGKNIMLTPDRTVASRKLEEYSCGYVFIKRPIRANEKVIIQVLKIVNNYSGSLAFGITSCDPMHLSSNVLPEDSDNLMDRKEYWIVIKDVAPKPHELDELSFYFNERGDLYFQRNNLEPRVIFSIDHTQRIFFLFDVYANTLQIRLAGCCDVKSVNRSNNTSVGGNGDRRQTLPNNSLVPMISQSSAPTSPGPRQAPSFHSSGSSQLLVNLPPPQPMASHGGRPPRATNAQSLPSLYQPVSTNNNNNVARGTNNGRMRTGPPPPPSRPPPPQWPQQPPQSSAQPQPTLVFTNSSCGGNFGDVTSSGASKQDAVGTVTAAMGQMGLNASGRGGASAASNDDGCTDECAVCMQSRVDCVLYTCGHMCMCYNCAVLTWQKHGFCPVCRQPIKDVIKTYKSS